MRDVGPPRSEDGPATAEMLNDCQETRSGASFAYMGLMRKISALLALAMAAACAMPGCAAEDDEGNEDGVESAEDMLAQIGSEPTGRASKHAIVLAHGFDASDTNRWSFYKLEGALERDGHLVHAARVQPYRGVADRAKELATHVDQAIEECKAKPGCDAPTRFASPHNTS